MSHAAAAPPKGIATRFVQASILFLLFALLFLTTRAVPEIHEGVGTIAAVGFLLLTGTLMSELVETIRVPHLTGYLLAGIIAGPHVLKLIDHHTVGNLTQANALALALIALEGGAELKLDIVKRSLKSLAWATLLQSSLVIVGIVGVFLLLRPMMPFLAGMGASAVFGVALLWGVLSVTRSPSACLGILSQTRATGPVATFTLTFVMTSDVVVVVLVAASLTVATPLIEPGGVFSLQEFRALGREILGSVALGTTLGLVLAAYVRLVNKQLILVFLALGFGLSEVMRYLQYDALLAFMMAGFVVQNLSQQGEKFLHAIQRMGGIIYIIFFATAGADLDIPLLRALWPVAVSLVAARAIITAITSRISSRIAGDGPEVKKWGWSGLISQAGLALGLGASIASKYPTFGSGFRALAIATVALNEMIGPILFKFALDRSGETSVAPAPRRPSLMPGPQTGPS
jgi:Kef-type K+ transport system membrane component KefB